MEFIHTDTHPFDLGPRWTVERQPHATTDPNLVRFWKQTRTSTRLDQIARWTGQGWDSARWVPAHPQVPRTLIGIVERYMRGMAP